MLRDVLLRPEIFMSDDFTYKCRRRFGGRPISPTTEENIAARDGQLCAGSGGDWGNDHSSDKPYEIKAPIVSILSRTSPLDDSFADHQINLLALEDDGQVLMRAGQMMEISTGPADPANPVLMTKAFHGVKLRAADHDDISIQRGILEGGRDFMYLQPDGIFIFSEHQKVSISSPKRISLAVGMNTITIDTNGISIVASGPAGVTIQGVPVKIN